MACSCRRRERLRSPRLLAQGALGRDERIVLFNTGSGLKYPEVVTLTVPVMNPDDEL
jgi:threonine synthase